jgi:hypothetical protein
MKKNLLVVTQLSNYDSNGKFILEADSGWQMCIGRVRELLKLNPELTITITGPDDKVGHEQFITHPYDINPDLWTEKRKRLTYVGLPLIPNALVSRYDFNWKEIGDRLLLGWHHTCPHRKFDAVYINDPMHLRNFKALFHVVGKYTPKFFVHSHFIDNPECPKFPTEASLWLGQCEAALKADHNFWQCGTSMKIFFESFKRDFSFNRLRDVEKKSEPWDDGYSIEEIERPVDFSKLRFTENEFNSIVRGRTVVFVPNRIGGMGRSSDYTNCGKFMFEMLPKLRSTRKDDDYVVFAGNPSQKFTNVELMAMCSQWGYVSLVPNAFNRDEYRYVAAHSDIVLGIYDKDTYGSTASRECVDLGCIPLWLDVNEYHDIAYETDQSGIVLAHDMDNVIPRLNGVINTVRNNPKRVIEIITQLRDVIRNRCSYEKTTLRAARVMGLV